MATNNQIITALAKAVKDADARKRDRSVYAQILTEAMDWVTEETECLRKVDSTSVILTADEDTYDLMSTFIKFPTEDAERNPAPVTLGDTGKFQLEMTTPTKLEILMPGWRAASSGVPQFCFVERQGTLKLILVPAPSSAFIAANGSKVFIDHIFRATAIDDDSNSPFDSSDSLRGLQTLLKFRAQWQIWLEDQNFAAADRFDRETMIQLEHAKDLVQSVYSTPGTVVFGRTVRSD